MKFSKKKNLNYHFYEPGKLNKTDKHQTKMQLRPSVYAQPYITFIDLAPSIYKPQHYTDFATCTRCHINTSISSPTSLWFSTRKQFEGRGRSQRDSSGRNWNHRTCSGLVSFYAFLSYCHACYRFLWFNVVGSFVVILWRCCYLFFCIFLPICW